MFFSSTKSEYVQQIALTCAAAPDKFVICSCCTNGYNGYFPTKEAFAEGGYEAKTTNFIMELARNEETGVLYAAYNPYPRSLLADKGISQGRTPFIIRKSLDDGKTWSYPFVVEEEPDRGYCYPAMFFTKDKSMLCAYCRGGEADKSCLARLGIMKIALDEI